MCRGGWGAAGRQEPSCQPGCQGGRVHTRCPIKLPQSRQRLRAFWVGHDITKSQSGARQPFFLLWGLSLRWWRHILWRVDAWTQCVLQPVAALLIFQAEPATPESYIPFRGLPGRRNGLPGVPFKPELPASLNESAPFKIGPFAKNNPHGQRNMITMKQRQWSRRTWV